MMDEDEEDIYRQELAQQIEIVFSDVSSYPVDDKIVELPLSGFKYQMPALFAGKSWKEISLEVMFQERFSLGYFTPEAFRYFLPAFLRAVLLYPDQMDTLWENIFYNLTPPEEEIDMEAFLNRINGFTQPQTEVIKAYIKLYVSIERSYPDPKRERASHFWMQR